MPRRGCSTVDCLVGISMSPAYSLAYRAHLSVRRPHLSQLLALSLACSHRGEPRALVTTVPRPPAVMALFRGRLQMPLSECGPALRRTRWGSGRGTAQPAAAPLASLFGVGHRTWPLAAPRHNRSASSPLPCSTAGRSAHAPGASCTSSGGAGRRRRQQAAGCHGEPGAELYGCFGDGRRSWSRSALVYTTASARI
jgi:hypothetical protein